ncbi:MAG: hypothetical protein JNL33_13010 [Betaproteobacteria bacterium]|nr:hypothetical protein [Betaproteobacteria bacterium]
MRPFDDIRTHRIQRLVAARQSVQPVVPRVFRARSRRGPVDWDIPTVLRRATVQR